MVTVRYEAKTGTCDRPDIPAATATPLQPTSFEKAEEKTPFKGPSAIQNSQTPAIECKRHHKFLKTLVVHAIVIRS